MRAKGRAAHLSPPQYHFKVLISKITSLASERTTLDEMFDQHENLLEQLTGHMVEIIREFRTQTGLDIDTIYPFGAAFSAYDP